MKGLIILDSGPLGLACNSRGGPVSTECNSWLRKMRRSGITIGVSAISDFEVRRELILAERRASVARLDRLIEENIYLPVTLDVVAKAGELWANARRLGRSTADPLALDGDVLIAAQAEGFSDLGLSVIVATFNEFHIGRYVRAKNWTEIKAEEI